MWISTWLGVELVEELSVRCPRRLSSSWWSLFLSSICVAKCVRVELGSIQVADGCQKGQLVPAYLLQKVTRNGIGLV